ncbi:ABC transporter permease [Caldicoprobacter faecalis]|uniref:Peptide/nickel transport system permease protein n=1 Tax=Caldicoprobacter faecalis TaxID=937334 RepID=A0A1I5SZS0_9FIRM|nr:ABC transporter permease [Caldicoprobacter faecalis]SFP75716.1 peptide/nickel transport system permease protein [Caldicoprobacter faecalis]
MGQNYNVQLQKGGIQHVVNSQSEIEVKERSYFGILWGRFKKNKMAVISLYFIIFLIVIAIVGPFVSPYHYTMMDYTALYQTPNAKHWMGTDDGGRDLATLIVYGLRNALIVGFGAGLVQVCIGVLVGAVAGYIGGRVDNILMRFVDIMFALPSFLLNLVLVVVLGRSLFTILLAIGLTSWAGMARLVRGQVLAVKQLEYIEAAKAMGASNLTIILRYVIPNSIGPIAVALSFNIPGAMMMESGLSLIGLGVMPPMPSWGGLISQGSKWMLSYPHMILFPAGIFALTILAFTFFGDGLRDAFDPKTE